MPSSVAQDLLHTIQARGALSAEARTAVSAWLEDPQLAAFVPDIQALVDQGNWSELEDCFYQPLRIGTGGIRGQIGPGPNRINSRTIGVAAQALCQFIEARGEDAKQAGVIVGHEARLHSRPFATLCCEVFAANGIPSHLFSANANVNVDVRSTPEVSFAVRYLKATAGVQITASHNPKTDNGFKFYWSYGGQVVPPLDREFMELIKNVGEVRRVPLDTVRGTLVKDVPAEVDIAYQDAVGSLSVVSNRSARVVFGAIHGAGKTNVLPVLERAGFEVLPIVGQLEPNDSFPDAAGKLINPEFAEVVQKALNYAQTMDADLAICSDPDADRAGVVARTQFEGGTLKLLRGDDVGAALTSFILEQRQTKGQITPNDLVLETFVTTSLIRDIAQSFNVECIDDLLVGFKWMAQIIEERNAANRVGFFFAAEESIGYLAGNFVRDKDASIAALLVAELASWLKDRRQTIWTYLDEVYIKHGCYKNLQNLIELPGKAGMEVMQEVMLGLRAYAESGRIESFGGRRVVKWKDWLAPGQLDARGSYRLGNAADMLTFWLSEDGRSRVTVRPSGTEPKLKYYVQLFEPVSGNLEDVKSRLGEDALAVAHGIVDLCATAIGPGLEAPRRAELAQDWARGEPRLV
jgi:phosphoglucomutase